jgi:cytochrome c5
MKRVAIIGFLLFFCFILSCRYDSEEELYFDEDQKCDTINVTFTNTIRPILTANCFSCHSGSNAGSFGAGINLEAYESLLATVNSGRLTGAIMHSPGFSAMPLDGTKLDDCSINKIRAWINSGALNN